MPGRQRRQRRGRGPDETATGSAEAPPAGGQADAEDPRARARQVCLRLLTLAPRTRQQLADALARRGIPEQIAQEILSRFTDVGLIDDAAFAKAWVESRHHSRGLAGRALRSELKRRGVDEENIRDAVGSLDPDEEANTARQLVQRRLTATRGLEPQARIRRLAGMLARKGYPAGLSFRVIREALEAEGATEAAEQAEYLEYED